ncbi:MAG: peptidylprolyl isomerase [Pseudomonadota bacterium]
MQNPIKRIALASFVAVFASATASLPVLAQEGVAPETVVVTVNGHQITEDELGMASQDFAEQLQRIPDAQRRGLLVDALIDLHLLANAAEAENLDDDAAFERRMAYERAQTLRTAYLVNVVGQSVDDATVQAAYDETVAGFEPQEERRARHILLETEEEAMEVIAELNGGADFATLAQEKSTGPSGPNGGDLGFFGPGQMVPPFEEAVFAMEAGNHSTEPVETQFGFHVILVEETRETAPPSFEQVAPQIRNELLQQNFVATVTLLREAADISYQDETLAPPEDQ